MTKGEIDRLNDSIFVALSGPYTTSGKMVTPKAVFMDGEFSQRDMRPEEIVGSGMDSLVQRVEEIADEQVLRYLAQARPETLEKLHTAIHKCIGGGQ